MGAIAYLCVKGKHRNCTSTVYVETCVFTIDAYSVFSLLFSELSSDFRLFMRNSLH